MSDNTPAIRKRLLSLDILRGADMFLLTVIGPLAYALNKSFGLPKAVLAQFDHAWGGFTLWDIIMPLFIFMSGAAVPFAMKGRLDDNRARWRYWRHVLSRFALLWVLGMVAQGRLLLLDADIISPFNNTLQTIAIGYLACAIVYRIPSRAVRFSIPAALAIFYTLILVFLGDYSKSGNAATRFENWFVPFTVPSTSRVLELADPGYTWWATIPMFAAMGLAGMCATEILKNELNAPHRRALRLATLGAALLAVGWALVPVIPPIKHIYTLSFTSQAMGWSMLALAALYALFDIRFAHSSTAEKSVSLLVLFGRTSLLAYLCEGVFSPVLNTFGRIFAPGFTHLFGGWAEPLVVWLASTILLVLILKTRYYALKFRFNLRNAAHPSHKTSIRAEKASTFPQPIS
jgi:predicted acyltransferase